MPGILRGEPADRLDRLDRVAPRLLLAGRDREGEAVDDDVARPSCPTRRRACRRAARRCAPCRRPVRAWPCSSIVSAMTAVPCSLTSGMMRPNRLVAAVAVLEVDGVDDGAPADELEPGLDDGGLGRVDHERQRRGAREARHDLADVGDAVAADVVDADVEQVRADADLVARDLDAVVPALVEHRLAERLRPVRVGALADREVRAHPARTARAGRGSRRRARPRRRGRRVVSPRLGERGDAAARRRRRRCSGVVPQHPPTSPSPNSRTNCSCAVRELVGRQRVVRAVRAVSTGRPAFGMHATGTVECFERWRRCSLISVGAGRAVQADRVDAERFERRERGADLAAHEHGAGRLDGHLDEDRQTDAAARRSPACSR